MKRYAKFTEFTDSYLDNMQKQLTEVIGDNVDQMIAPFISYKSEQDFKDNIVSILKMINSFGNRIDKLISLQIDESIDTMLNASLFESYYLITERGSVFPANIPPKGFNFFPSAQYLDKLNTINAPEKQYEYRKYFPSNEENIMSYLKFIDQKGWILKNNAINRYSIMEHQIKKLLQSNCFIQDILLDIIVSCSARASQTISLSFDEFNIHYGLIRDFDIEAKVKKINTYQLPFTPPYLQTKSKIGVDTLGEDIQMLFLEFQGFLELFDFNKAMRDSCTYQSMKSFSKLLSVPNKLSNKYEHMYLFEKITGANHCLHLFYFLLGNRNDRSVYDFIEYFYKSLTKYPNLFTRVYLIDEILCLIDKKAPLYDSIRICDYLDSYLPLYNEKYSLMSSFIFYYISKININHNNDIKYIINLLFEKIQEDNLPWTIHPKGIFISSEAQRYTDKYFVTGKEGKDKPNIFYKSVQNEILLLNK